MNSATLPNPGRQRTIERPFGWVPFRLVTSGLLARLSVAAKALYLALCLVADRRGLSYWGRRRLEGLVGLDTAGMRKAREELLRHDLLAYDGRLYQLLSLPAGREPGGRPVTEVSVPSRNKASPSRSGPTHVGAVLTSLMERLEGS
jgi:hypothetical protein